VEQFTHGRARGGARLVGVAVTSLAPERHAGVEMLAHGLGLPVFAPMGIGWAPYPITELQADDRLPVGDHPMTMAEVLALG
jgi:hypothetical protein